MGIRQGAWTLEPATNAQINFIRSLSDRTGYDPDLSLIRTKGDASRMIDWLKKQAAVAPARKELHVEDKILPKRMLDLIDEGRYAIRSDDGDEYIFLRVSRPKTGRERGSTKIQTQHGDSLVTQYQVSAHDTVIKRRHSRVKGMHLSDILINLMANQKQAAVDYGQRIERCCRCGRELTDARSQWFGIGPECEQHWPWVLEMVEGSKGVYVPESYV